MPKDSPEDNSRTVIVMESSGDKTSRASTAPSWEEKIRRLFWYLFSVVTVLLTFLLLIGLIPVVSDLAVKHEQIPAGEFPWDVKLAMLFGVLVSGSAHLYSALYDFIERNFRYDYYYNIILKLRPHREILSNPERQKAFFTTGLKIVFAISSATATYVLLFLTLMFGYDIIHYFLFQNFSAIFKSDTNWIPPRPIQVVLFSLGTALSMKLYVFIMSRIFRWNRVNDS